METLEKQVRRARRRLFVESLVARLSWCWFFSLLAAALAIGVGKLGTPAAQQAWAVGWLAAALFGGLAVAAVWAWIGRLAPLEAAVEVDRRCGLKERVSSTLALEPAERQSAIGQALARDAEQTIRHVDVADRFRLQLHRRTLLPLAPAAVAVALAALVPVRVPDAPAKSTAAAESHTAESTRSLAKKLEARRKEAAARGLEEIDPLLAKLEQGAKELAESSNNDRKQTLLALNDLVKDAQKRRDELSGAGDLKKQLAQLKDLQRGPAEKLGEALKMGDLDKAMEHLAQLQQDLAGGKLDPEAQQALARQLDELQQALVEKAEAHEKLMRELKERLEAQRRAGNLAQADQLQQQLDKLGAARPQMDQLAQIQRQLQEAARCMGEGDCERAAAALAQLGEELAGIGEDLAEMEMLEGTLEQFADCKKAMACMDCDGLGCAACQGANWEKHGGVLDLGRRQRGGGKGIGVGLGPGLGLETDPDGRFYDSAVKQQQGKGAAIVVGEADGPNRKGRVQEEIQSEFSTAPQNAADALSEQRLPRGYRDHAQKYFDTLREGTR